MEEALRPVVIRPFRRPSRKQQILAAATRVFIRSGTSATVAAVATECGVAPAAIHYHFKTKDELLATVLERISAEVSRQTRAGAGPNAPLLGYAEAMQATYRWLDEHPGEARLLYVGSSGTSPRVRKVRQDFLERHVRQVRKRLPQPDGRSRAEAVTDRLARRSFIALGNRLTEEALLGRFTDRSAAMTSMTEVGRRMLAAGALQSGDDDEAWVG